MGKTVLITGGSRGIGKELVRQFNKAGYAVAFSYLEHQEEAVRLANSIRITRDQYERMQEYLNGITFE